MAEHDFHVADAHGACGAGVFKIARPQEFSAHHAQQSSPAEQYDQKNEQGEGYVEQCRQNNNDV